MTNLTMESTKIRKGIVNLLDFTGLNVNNVVIGTTPNFVTKKVSTTSKLKTIMAVILTDRTVRQDFVNFKFVVSYTSEKVKAKIVKMAIKFAKISTPGYIITKEAKREETKITNLIYNIKALNCGSMDLQKFANVVQANKNMITPKETINIINVITHGWEKEASKDKVPETAIVYASSSSSVAARELVKDFPLISEERWVGTVSLQEKFNNLSRYLENVQDGMLVLTIAARDKVTANMKRVYVAKDGRVFVEMIPNKELDEEFLSEDYPKDGEFAELINNKAYTKEEMKDIEVKLYECLDFSPSQLRKAGETSFKTAEGRFEDLTEDVIKEGREKIYEVMDRASDGMSTIQRNKGLVTYKKAVKGYARISQPLAPSTVLDLVLSYALIIDDDYMSPVDGGGLGNSEYRGEAWKKLYDNKVEFSLSHLSGQITQARPAGTKNAFKWSRPEYLKTLLNRFVKIKITRENISKEMQKDLEDCFDHKCKKYAPVDLELMEGKIYKITEVERNGKKEKEYDEYKFEDDSLKQEVLDSFNGNGRFLVVDGVLHLAYVFIIGDEQDCPDFITDLNGFKAPIDFSRQSKFVVLDESKEMQDRAKLSMQMLSTLLLKKDAVDMLQEEMLNNINEDWESFTKGDSIDPTIESVQKFYLGNYMQTGAKHFIYNHDAAAFRTLCNQFLNKQNKKLERFNLFTRKSTFARLTSDWALFIIGQRLLKEGECYSPDANRAYLEIERDLIDGIVDYQKNNTDKFAGIVTVSAKALRATNTFDELNKGIKDETLLAMVKHYYEVKSNHETIVFRSPKMVFGEFARFKAVTLEEICQRIDDLNITNDLKEILKQDYKDLKEGTFVLPAYEKYKALLGGADFDFDGVNVICDQIFIKMMKGIESCIVSVGKGKVENELKFKICDFDYAFDVFMLQTFNGNMSIGEITNMNQLLELLLFVPDKEVTWLFKRHFKNEENKPLKKYVSPLDYTKEIIEITPELTDEIVDRIGYAKLETNAELRAIIMDLNIVFRGYQERTIDAAKTADVIKIIFNLSAGASLLCLSDTVECKISWGDNKDKKTKAEKTYNPKLTEIIKTKNEFGKVIEFLRINDVFHDIQKKCCDRLEEIANKMIEKESTIQLTEAQGAYLERIGNKYNDYLPSLVDICFRYDEADGMRRSMQSSLATNDPKVKKFYRKTVMPEISRKYNETKNALTNMIRTMFAKYKTLEEKTELAAFLKYASCGTMDENKKVTVDLKKRSSVCHMLLPDEYALLVAKLDEYTKTITKSRVFLGKKYEDGEEIVVANGLSQNTDERSPFITDRTINGTFKVQKDKNSVFVVDDVKNYLNLNAPETRQLVLKLALPKGSDYTLLYNKVEAHKDKVMLVTAFNGGNEKDCVYFIEDGILMTCSKYAIQKGINLFNKNYNGFQGTLSSINYYVGKSKEGKEYPTLLIVLNEVEEKVKYRTMTKDEIKAQAKADKQAAIDLVKAKTEKMRKEIEKIRKNRSEKSNKTLEGLKDKYKQNNTSNAGSAQDNAQKQLESLFNSNDEKLGVELFGNTSKEENSSAGTVQENVQKQLAGLFGEEQTEDKTNNTLEDKAEKELENLFGKPSDKELDLISQLGLTL